MIRDELIKAIKSASGSREVKLEFPENEAFGDYTTNVALIEGKKNGVNPRELADQIISKLAVDPSLNELVEKIEPAGPGFINFWLQKDAFLANLMQIEKEKEKYGFSDIGKGKTVIIDYSSPNIAKPFGIGHLRSTIIGAALYNLYQALSYEVIGDNHLGDWGTQFGKLLYMIDKEKIKEFDIARLEELYVEFHKLAEKDEALEEEARKWFKKLEEGDSEAKSIWKKCVDVSMEEFNRIYKMLGVKIDFAFGESYYESEMKQLMNDPAVLRHLSVGEDHAEIIDLSGEGIKTPLMFLKSDGATTYATRDLATLKFRARKWNPDIIIYEVGAEQTLHFQQVFAAGKLLGLISKDTKLVHTAHGLYLASDGKKFSTRKGKTVKLEEVLNEAIERAEKLGNSNKNVATEVGIGAIKYYDLMHSVQSNVVFDWEKMMNLEGNSGPYLQYTVARTNSVLAKAKKEKLQNEIILSRLSHEERSVLRDLIKFQEVIIESAQMYAPNLLCNYLYELASKYNSFYNKERIIGSDKEEFLLSLTLGVCVVLKNGLKLLGIETPEKM